MDEESRRAAFLKTIRLREEAYRRYLDAIVAAPAGRLEYLPYDLRQRVEKANWRLMADHMVSDELRELINVLNRWTSWIGQWEIWLSVLAKYPDEQDRWFLRVAFVESLAYWCMHRPSAIRDLFTRVATNAIHQANLSLNQDTKDALDEDKNPFLRRSQKEEQLSRIGTSWPEAKPLNQSISAINGREYRNQTRDYRNRSSHGIAPRFEFGEVNLVTRHITDHEELVPQADGTYRLRKDPARKAVAYGFGGTPPLSLSEMLQANKSELRKALEAFNDYRKLLEAINAALGSKKWE